MRYIEQHFKRRVKRRKRLTNRGKFALILLIILVYLILKLFDKPDKTEFAYKEMVQQTEEKVIEVKRMQAEADITKAVLELKGNKTDRFVTEINNNVEYITLTEKGNFTINHSRIGQDAGWWKRHLNQSEATINFDYSAIFGIQTEKIDIYNNDNTIHINYEMDDIKVKAVEPSNIAVKTDKDIFGKTYSNQEVVSLVEVAKDNIRDLLDNSTRHKEKSSENINKYFTQLGNKMDIDNLEINSIPVIEKSYEFIDKGKIKYNHPDLPLESVDYIVIHSTACLDVTALQFYDNLNSSVQEREASVHFFIDDKNVVQCLPTNMQSWNCGTKNPKIAATNLNTLAIEICEFTDPAKQVKAINNAADFVEDVLSKQFPDAKIVTHRSIAPTKCPHIISDETFQSVFNPKR